MVTVVTDLNNVRGSRIHVSLSRASGPVEVGDVVTLQDISEPETVVTGRVAAVDSNQIAEVAIVASGLAMMLPTLTAVVFTQNVVIKPQPVQAWIETIQIPEDGLLVS